MHRTVVSWPPRWTIPSEWRTVIAERDVVVARAASLGDRLLVVSSTAAVDTVELWTTDGTFEGNVDEFGLISVQSLDTDDDMRLPDDRIVRCAAHAVPPGGTRTSSDGRPSPTAR